MGIEYINMWIVDKINLIHKLASNRNWGRESDILHRNQEIIIIARFSIGKYKKKYDELKSDRLYLEEDILNTLDIYLIDTIREFLPKLKGTKVILYSSESANRIDTIGVENTAGKFTI